MVLMSWLVVQRSESAFTATTGNTANNLTTGSVILADNDGGSALFNVNGILPAQVETRCIEVTYSGSITPTVPIRIYGGYADGPDAGTTVESTLAPYLALTIEMGAAATTCASIGSPTTIFNASLPGASTGMLDAFTTTNSTYASGLSTGWTPTGGSSTMRPFRITMTLSNDNNAQNKAAEPAFTWEARSA